MEKQRATDFRNRPLRERFEIALVALTFLSVFVMAILLLVWAIYPYKTIDVTNAKMDKTVVRQGEVTNYTMDYVKYADSVSVHRFFVDGLIFDAGTVIPIRPQGSGHGVSPLQIPRTLPPGKYKLRVIVTFKPNPIRTIEYEFYTNQFEVIAAGEDT